MRHKMTSPSANRLANDAPPQLAISKEDDTAGNP
jgi:hypothetical protein